MTTQLHFYDSAEPRNVPNGVYAGVYINGYAWSEAEQDRMRGIFRISVLREASWARWARCLDIENHAALPEDLPPFVHHRWACGFNDATGYVNRDNWERAWQLCKDAKVPEPLWWVSTLDGTQNVELTVGGVIVARAWAVQYETVHGYDLSVLHGVDNFHRP